MIGLSHFVYHDLTASLVPKWMRFPLGWTYLPGAGSLAAAAGMLFGVYPRLAANLEAAMLWIITLLVWVPRVASMPRSGGLDGVLHFLRDRYRHLGGGRYLPQRPLVGQR